MNVTHYYSESKQTLLPIVEMESNHIANVIKKLCKAGERAPLVSSLQQELDKRTKAAMESVASEATKDIACCTDDTQATEVKLTDSQSEAFNKAEEGVIRALTSLQELREIAGVDSLDQAWLQRCVNVVRKGPIIVSPSCADVSLSDILRERRFKSLLNSLAGHGVHTLQDLTGIHQADFAAVRFSTVAAFSILNKQLNEAGLNWGTTTRIFNLDGVLNPYTHPVTRNSVNNYLGAFCDAYGSMLRGAYCAFESVKRRVTQAITSTTLLLLARGYTANTAKEEVDALNRTQSFKDQVMLRLRRINHRAWKAVDMGHLY